jgi:hypothetical protein
VHVDFRWKYRTEATTSSGHKQAHNSHHRARRPLVDAAVSGSRSAGTRPEQSGHIPVSGFDAAVNQIVTLCPVVLGKNGDGPPLKRLNFVWDSGVLTGSVIP